MFALDDKRWTDLKGGYRTQFDPRPLLSALETGKNTKAVWHELWEDLHHQGDVGEASYAAVPHLVRIYRRHRVVDWNIYAIVAVIELAREERENPPVPTWMEEGYSKAIQELAEIGTVDILKANDEEDIRAILSVIAISRGARTHARFLLNYSAEELLEIENKGSP
jgi:hypothetical protein